MMLFLQVPGLLTGVPISLLRFIGLRLWMVVILIKEMQYHDQVYLLQAPFYGDPVKFIATEMRYSGITWGKDNFALISEGSAKSRIRITSSFSPADPPKQGKKYLNLTVMTVIMTRSFYHGN